MVSATFQAPMILLFHKQVLKKNDIITDLLHLVVVEEAAVFEKLRFLIVLLGHAQYRKGSVVPHLMPECLRYDLQVGSSMVSLGAFLNDPAPNVT